VAASDPVGRTGARDRTLPGRKLRIRKELRSVRSQLELDIKSLGMWIKIHQRAGRACCSPASRCWSRCGIAAGIMPSPCCAREPAMMAKMMRHRSLALAGAAAVADRRPGLSFHRSSHQGDLGGGICSRIAPARQYQRDPRLSRRRQPHRALRKQSEGWSVVEREYPADTGACATWR
jgi:hypothetical protein